MKRLFGWFALALIVSGLIAAEADAKLRLRRARGANVTVVTPGAVVNVRR